MVSNDSIPYVWFSFYLLSNKKFFKKILITIILAFFTIINYSRINIVEYFIIILAFIFCKVMDKPKKALLIASILLFFIPFFILTFNGFNDSINQLFQMRFKSVSSDYSDQIRTIQTEYLLKGFYDKVLFGHGSGSYVREYLRSDTIFYSYEKEYLSFLYQFGIIGFLLIVVGTIMMFKSFCFYNIGFTKGKIMVFVLFLIWIIKPVFNPSFLSSNSGIILVCLFAFFNNQVFIRNDNYSKKTLFKFNRIVLREN
jgi:hypothetical protein